MKEIIIPPVTEAPQNSNATDLVENQFHQDPNHPLFALQLQSGEWTDVSASEFREDAKTIARALASVGIAPGDSVAIMSPTRYEWTLMDLAIMYAGAVTVPIYETSSPSQVAWIIEDSKVKAAIVEKAEHARAVNTALQREALQRLEALTAGGDDRQHGHANGVEAQLHHSQGLDQGSIRVGPVLPVAAPLVDGVQRRPVAGHGPGEGREGEEAEPCPDQGSSTGAIQHTEKYACRIA